jgi:hypothetical protein
MRYLLVVILLFSSCSLTMYNGFNRVIGDENYSEYEDYELDIELPEDVNSLSKLCFWITDTLKYERETGHKFKDLEEVWESKKGDCKSYSILFMTLAKSKFNVDPYFIAVVTSDNRGHAIVRIGDVYYDPTWGYVLNDTCLVQHSKGSPLHMYFPEELYYKNISDLYWSEPYIENDYAESIYIMKNSDDRFEFFETGVWIK